MTRCHSIWRLPCTTAHLPTLSADSRSPTYLRSSHGRRDTHEAADDARSHRADIERDGADCAGRVPLAHVLPTERLRRAARGTGHVVRHFRSRPSLPRDSDRLRGALEALPRCRLVVLLRRAGVSLEGEIAEVRARREVHRRL